jgi:phage gp46-like protein
MIVDIAHKLDSEGVFDFVVTDDGDLATSTGLESPLVVSLFSDRRAYEDEVPDPMRRRGWLHANLVGQSEDENFGSGIWLYEQARLSSDTVLGVEMEVRQALDWMIEERLISGSEVRVTPIPGRRLLLIAITLILVDGNVVEQAWVVADATVTGTLIENQ